MKNNQFDALDIITILSFQIAMQNLEENRKQTENTQMILNELDKHLKKQDEILENQDKILYDLKDGDNNESKRNNK